jgi:hypothetical protein
MRRRGKRNQGVRARESVNPDESTLVVRLRAGDEEAFEVLVSRYYGSLLRFAMSFVSERATAEEVVQETWLGVVSGPLQLRRALVAEDLDLSDTRESGQDAGQAGGSLNSILVIEGSAVGVGLRAGG